MSCYMTQNQKLLLLERHNSQWFGVGVGVGVGEVFEVIEKRCGIAER